MSGCMACGATPEPGYKNLVACGKGAYLCRDCLSAMLRCTEARELPTIVESAGPAPPSKDTAAIPTPAELVAELDKAVIGQTAAKQLLSVAAWKHLQRISGNAAAPKSHVLLYGPTGCGKTHLARSMATLMDVPFVSVDATTFSETGYKGKDVKDIVLDVLDAAHGDEKRTKHAVVFVDEFDKLSAVGGEARAAYQHGTQHAFLTLLEGAPVTVERHNISTTVDPSGLLFVFAGAFSGIEDILSARLQPAQQRPIGFGRDIVETEKPEPAVLLTQALPQDFVQYGIKAELMGRIPILAPILPLTEAELVRILLDANNSLCAQYTAFFRALDTQFSLTSDAAQVLAQEAHALGTGARGLRGRLERVITQLIFTQPPGSGIHITAEMLREEEGHDALSESRAARGY